MNEDEADAILQKHGFVLVDYSGSGVESVVVYRRKENEPLIILTCSRQGIVVHKHRDSEVENALQKLSSCLQSD